MAHPEFDSALFLAVSRPVHGGAAGGQVVRMDEILEMPADDVADFVPQDILPVGGDVVEDAVEGEREHDVVGVFHEGPKPFLAFSDGLLVEAFDFLVPRFELACSRGHLAFQGGAPREAEEEQRRRGDAGALEPGGPAEADGFRGPPFQRSVVGRRGIRLHLPQMAVEGVAQGGVAGRGRREEHARGMEDDPRVFDLPAAQMGGVVVAVGDHRLGVAVGHGRKRAGEVREGD